MQKKKNGRPRIIPQKFYEYDFKEAAKTEKNARIKVKLLVLEQIKKGREYIEAARIFNVDQTIIKQWVMRVALEGLIGLKTKPGRGRKQKLKQDQAAEFKKEIHKLQEQRSGGRINVADITNLANEKFGTTYKVKGMYGLLHKLGMVWISARSVHPAHNQAAQDAFKKTL
jgi:transposase